MNTKDYTGIRHGGPLPAPKDISIPDDMADMLDDYYESSTSQLEELEAAVLECESGQQVEENEAAIRRILHKLKGEAGMMGIMDIEQLCHQVEFAVDELDPKEKYDMLLRVNDWFVCALNEMGL